MQAETPSTGLRSSHDIRPLSPDAAERLARTELQAFLEMLSGMAPTDWDKPTPCTLWSVRDVVAHQAAHARIAGLRGLLAQASPFATKGFRKPGMSTNDALNQAQVERRRTLPVDAVVAELRDVTPRAIDARAHIPWWARQVRLPVPPAGMMRLDKLLVEIFPRDMWIHRLDIADATGRPFEQRAEHDGVLLEQVVADTAYLVHKRGGGVNLNLRLAGPAGGAWNVASPGAEEVNLSMEATDFMRLSSGRATLDAVLERVTSDAQPAATRRILALLVAPY